MCDYTNTPPSQPDGTQTPAAPPPGHADHVQTPADAIPPIRPDSVPKQAAQSPMWPDGIPAQAAEPSNPSDSTPAQGAYAPYATPVTGQPPAYNTYPMPAPAQLDPALRERFILKRLCGRIGLFFWAMEGISVLLVLLLSFFNRYMLHALPFTIPQELVGVLENTAVYLFAFGAPLLVWALWKGAPLSRTIPLRLTRGTPLVSGVLICMYLSLSANSLSSVFLQAFAAVGIEFTAPDVAIPEGGLALLFTYIQIALIPAFLEEFVCRGMVLQPLRQFGDRFAIVFSAAVFGIMHGNLFQAPFAFVMGLVFGYFAVKTGSLWVGIIAHGLNNALSVTLMWLQEYQPDLLNSIASSVALVLYAAGIGALIYYCMRNRNNLSVGRDDALNSFGKRMAIGFSPVSMILFILLMAITTARYTNITWFSGSADTAVGALRCFLW